MHLTSPAFRQGGELPVRFTCDGQQHSPPLEWDELPDGTRSLVLLIIDPDAPSPDAADRHTFTHWIVYNLPPEVRRLDEAAEAASILPRGTGFGLNDGQVTGYVPPCPPRGRHRYVHRLYALDSMLPELDRPTRNELLENIEGHVLGTAELVGSYVRH